MNHAIIPSLALSVLLATSPAFGQSTKPEDSPPSQDAIAATLPADALAKAQGLQGSGQWVEAAALYLQITEAQPENGTAWFNLGYCLHAAGELDLAVSAHRKAATFEAFTGIALYNLGCAFSLLGEADEAFEALQASHDAGFNVSGNLDTDSDFTNLRQDERFVPFQNKLAADRPPSKFAQGQQSVMAMLRQAQQYLAQNGPAMMEQAKMMVQQAAGLAQQKFHQLQEMADDEEQMTELKARLHEAFGRAHQAFLQWRESMEQDGSANEK